MQCGGRIWAGVTINLYVYICPVTHWNAIIVAPHVYYALDPRACAYTTHTRTIWPCDLTFVVCRCYTKWMSMSRFLTGDDIEG